MTGVQTCALPIFLTNKLLLVVIGGQKSDFCGRFKLELVKIAHLRFVVKVS